MQKIHTERMNMERYALKMKYLHPVARLREKQQIALEYERRMHDAIDKKLRITKHKFEIYIEKMKGLSPLAKLNKGFSYVASEKGRTVKSIQDVRKDELLQIHVTDGVVKARVEDLVKEDYYGR